MNCKTITIKEETKSVTFQYNEDKQEWIVLEFPNPLPNNVVGTFLFDHEKETETYTQNPNFGKDVPAPNQLSGIEVKGINEVGELDRYINALRHNSPSESTKLLQELFWKAVDAIQKQLKAGYAASEGGQEDVVLLNAIINNQQRLLVTAEQRGYDKAKEEFISSEGEEAIGFAEFLGNENLEYDGNGNWLTPDLKKTNDGYALEHINPKPTAELYNLYKSKK